MHVKEAISVAKSYVRDVYAEEELLNVGLEETEFDGSSQCWSITIGFSRAWNTPRTRAQEVLKTMGALPALRRTYKVVTIAADGEVVSMKDKDLAEEN
jgi:hypothetical protein